MRSRVLTAAEFGRQLVESGDLDPIYLMLNAGVPEWGTRARWCLAYWMFYHAGTSCRIAEAGEGQFWDQVWAAQVHKWPRGTERRHFKGALSARAIEALSERFPLAEDAVEYAAGPRRFAPVPAFEVMARTQEWRGFGPWISFKVADMTDAVLQRPVDFSNAVPDFFVDPRLGAYIVARQQREDPLLFHTMQELKSEFQTLGEEAQLVALDVSMRHLKDELWNLKAPHANRELRNQEYETILCKYKSHLNGKYPVGKDTREIVHGLTGQGALAAHLRDVLLQATDHWRKPK